MTSNDREVKALQTISDPNFDVIEFAKHLNAHFENDMIIRTLCKDATIVLALVESKCGGLLEHRPDFIDHKIFEKMYEMGYETWVKGNPNGSQWYGVIIDETLAFHFRYLAERYGNNARNFEILTKPCEGKKSLADGMRKKWRRLRMTQKGVAIEPKKERKPPSDPKVNKIRYDFNIYLRNHHVNWEDYKRAHHNGWSQHQPAGNPPLPKQIGSQLGGRGTAEYRFSLYESCSYNTSYWNRKVNHVDFRILADGPKNIRVSVDGNPATFIWSPSGGYPKRSKHSWNKDVCAVTRIPINDPKINEKILSFVLGHTFSGKELKNFVKPSLKQGKILPNSQLTKLKYNKDKKRFE